MNILNATDEKKLLQRLNLGDEGAFTIVYNIYWPVMYLHAFKMLQSEDDAKDVLQELFINFHAKSGELKEGTSLSGYLYISLRNRIINLVRQQKIKVDYLESLALFTERTGNNVLEQLHEKELRHSIESEIERLPAKMRQVFELSRKEFLSHKEIACRLQISDKTVKTQINNALRSLKLKLGTISIVAINVCAFLSGIK